MADKNEIKINADGFWIAFPFLILLMMFSCEPESIGESSAKVVKAYHTEIQQEEPPHE